MNTPTITLWFIVVVLLSLTIVTILQVIFIDLKHAKERYRKAKVANLIIWLVVCGAILNAPFIIMAIRGTNNGQL